MPNDAMGVSVHIDGGSRGNPGPAAAGVVIHRTDGVALLEAGYFLGEMTNNQAEYRALLLALEALASLEADNITIHSDSELMVRQITGQYKVRSADLKPLFEQAQRHLLSLSSWQIRHVPREQNRRADQLANRAMNHQANVVEIEVEGGSLESPRESSTPSAGAATNHSPSTTVTAAVVARVVSPPNSEICPAVCRQGKEFCFGTTVPEDLCINAAQTLLSTVMALQHVPASDNNEAFPPMTLRCLRADCTAVFEVHRETTK